MTPSVYYSVRSSDITRQSTAAESGEREGQRGEGCTCKKGVGKVRSGWRLRVRRI